MCRWIAYRGEPTALERYVTSPAHSLVEQSMRALESTAATNGDGFGLGWYADLPDPGVYREVRPAWSDDNLRNLCRHIRSHLFFAHVRATTGTAVTRPNCHPFVSGPWMFMHNGVIGDWSQIRRPVEAMIPDELYPARLGTTDSEAVFLAIMGGADDPVGATTRVLNVLTGLVNSGAQRDPLRFTSAMTDGKDLYAFRYAVNDNANSLYYRAAGDDVVIVSEPLDKDRSIWTAVPANHVLIARAGERVELAPMFAEKRQAAE
jgi:glutamine amidotransferase